MKRYLVSVAFTIVCAVACDNAATSHVYIAMLYETANNCLEDNAEVDVVNTGDGSLLCAPTCLVAAHPGGTETVYVSTMCGPYPIEITDTSGTDPACAPALAAYDNGCSCGEDGGPACAPAGGSPDGGEDDAGGGDSGDAGGGSSDGATDAPVDG